MAVELTVPHKIDWDRGGIQSSFPEGKGFKATVVFQVPWDQQYTFAIQLLGGFRSGANNLLTYDPPFRFPPNPVAVCTSIESIEPMGDKAADGGSKWSPYATAIVRASFSVPDFATDRGAVEPGSQIDPENPILYAKQSIQGASRFRVTEEGQIKFANSGKIIESNEAIPENQVRFVLEFQRLWFVPWTTIAPYLGGVNKRRIFAMDPGYVLFDDFDVSNEGSAEGGGLTLRMTFLGHLATKWNERINDEGEAEPVVYKDSGEPVFKEKDFWQFLPS